MLRDLVVFCALVPWTTTSLEDALLVFRGISHRKVYEMILDLERAGAVIGEKGEEGIFWTATDLGVLLFMNGKRKNIPVSIVQEVLTIAGVKKLGGPD